MKYVFKKILAAKRNQKPIVIVSGLPRSGTSMMMQMLEAGGLPVVTDQIRKPDEDNPHGYYELERVKEIRKDTSWLENCRGKAFKMVSALLYYLPGDMKYKVLFMVRDMEEMLASQEVMLQRLRGKGVDTSYEEMAEKLTKHLWHVKEWLEKQRNMEVIYVNYNEVILNPEEKAKTVTEFLECQLDRNRMYRVVDKKLYRKRSGHLIFSP